MLPARFSHLSLLTNGLDSANHVQAHLDAAVGVVGSGFGQSGHAVVAIAQQFDPQTVILLPGTTSSIINVINCKRIGRRIT